MQLNFDIEEELSVLEQYRITPEEFFVVRLLFLVKDDEENLIYLKRYLSIFKDTFRDILISLQNKGIILKSYKIPNKGEKLDVYEIEFNKNFMKNIYRSSGEMGEELFEHYPQFGNINGSTTPIRSVSKKFIDLEDAWRKYGKIIRWNPDTHKEIIELLDWANENNVINKSLGNFICDHSWLDLKALRDGDSGINYDTVKML